MPFNLKKVCSDDVYETIHNFVEKRDIIVEDYQAMINVILDMIKDGYCFTMDRDILRDAMESLTYMYSPSDDMNKDRLVQQFCDDIDSDDEDDSDEGDDNNFGNMDLMKMMQMMGGMNPPECQPCETTEKKSEEVEVVEDVEDVEDVEEVENSDDCKKVVTDENVVVDDTKVVKENNDSGAE